MKVVCISVSLLGVGALLFGLAPNTTILISGKFYPTDPLFNYQILTKAAVIFFAAGFGVRVSTLSLATSWVDEDLQGHFYGIIQIVENIGLLIWEPFLQNIF